MAIKKKKKASAASTKRTASRPIKKRRSAKKNSFKRQHLAWLSAALGVVLCVYVIYLDMQIRSQFDGRKWALPARVFARPLELYPGLHLEKEKLLQELALLNYSAKRSTPGSYSEQSRTVLIHTRGFSFWDNEEPSRRIQLRFDAGILSDVIDDDTNESLGLTRLEPVQIASIYPAHKEDRELLQLGDVRSDLLASLLAVEDKDFDGHWGVKPLSILRALLVNLRAGEKVQGGSTLTQQLVKNFFLSNERSYRRKAVEAIMALLLEYHYSKDEILETYLNEVYLGQDGDRAVHGFALASRYYFDRPLAELKTEQLALLVGLVKGPSYYDPRRHPDRAKARRNLVLDVMQNEGLLDEYESARLRLSPLAVVEKKPHIKNTNYPAFMDMVRRTLKRDYRDKDLRSEGLRIFTTMDPVLQLAAEHALSDRLKRLEQYYGFSDHHLQGAVVLTSVDSGEVLAIVGDRDPRYPGFNRALDAHRPIGSLVKPAVYYQALTHSGVYHPLSLIDDSPLGVRGADGREWRPQNYDKTFHGEVPLVEALTQSYNVATIRLGLTLGLDKIVRVLNEMGLDTLEDERRVPEYPSILLGAIDLAPLEVAQMYQTLAAQGFRVPLNAVREVLTVHNQPLQRYPLRVRQTLENSSAVFMVNSLLQKVVEFGTARKVGEALPALKAAGKTGTSDDLRDSWFAGFTGEHLAVVWVGRDDNQPSRLTGSTGALPVWVDLMKKLDSRPLSMPMPQNIALLEVDRASQLLSNGKCEKVMLLPFIIGTEPNARAECQRKSFWQRLFK